MRKKNDTFIKMHFYLSKKTEHSHNIKAYLHSNFKLLPEFYINIPFSNRIYKKALKYFLLKNSQFVARATFIVVRKFRKAKTSNNKS